MALRPPDAPSLHFKEREGFITTAVDEPEEEFVEEEPVEGEEEFIEEEPVEDDEEFVEEEPVEDDEEFWEEESVEEEPVEEVEEEPQTFIEKALPGLPERREPTVVLQPADTGGRTGTALPTPQQMQEYSQPENRGKAIIRHFEEEDRRMNEQRTETTVETKDDSIFNFEMTPPEVGGGTKWLLLIAALTVLGYTVVRQLAMDPIKPTRARMDELSVGNEIKKPPVVKPKVKMPPPTTEKDALRHKVVQRAATTSSMQSSAPTSKASKEELIERALKEVRAASEASDQVERKQTPRPRQAPKLDNKPDDVKHIEIRI